MNKVILKRGQKIWTKREARNPESKKNHVHNFSSWLSNNPLIKMCTIALNMISKIVFYGKLLIKNILSNYLTISIYPCLIKSWKMQKSN